VHAKPYCIGMQIARASAACHHGVVNGPTSERTLLCALFDAAVAAVDPAVCVPPHLPDPPAGRTLVIGYGKAAAKMAAAVERHWSGPLEGLAITRYGHGVPCARIEVIEAGHPLPDAASADAARRALDLARGLGPDDLLLALASGGGSATLSLPADGIALAEKRALVAALLRSGTPIADFNFVRMQLSAVKGGRLAAATRARVHSIVISDVPGDDPALVASGPTFADNGAGTEALAVLRRWKIAVPDAVAARLDRDVAAVSQVRHSWAVAATAATALDAAAAFAMARGIEAIILSDRLEGGARDLGAAHGCMAREHVGRPLLILSGGETSVSVTGPGRGGRNLEYLAGLMTEIAGLPITALAADNDGIDGSEDNAGGFVDGTTMARLDAAGLDHAAALARNDSYALFAALGDLLVTGPTRTNVNDFRAILIGSLS